MNTKNIELETIIAALARMVANKKGIDIALIKPESTLESLELDSLDVFDLIFSAEHKYDIRFPKHIGIDDVRKMQDVAVLTQNLILKKSL